MKLSITAVLLFPIIGYAILHLIPFGEFSPPILAWGITFILLLSIEGILVLRLAMKLPTQKPNTDPEEHSKK